MTNAMTRLGMQRPSVYSIRVEGWIADRWKDWFDGMGINIEGSMDTQATSTLQGIVADQAALLGVLHKLYDLGFPILRVERKESSQADSVSALDSEDAR